ncbi:MAG: thermonuclease family protein [Flavobacteriaceae bacterium]|nr:thermonuclease family protein [Flavobacteriaceae bacterium]
MRTKLTIIFLIKWLCLVAQSQYTEVVRVIDGDTFEILGGEKVRMIGINAPELSDVYGFEAKRYLKQLIDQKQVILKQDTKSKNRDRYQRLLRYVYLDEVDVNLKMIEDGFAFAYLKYKFEKSDSYRLAQLNSKENSRGVIWNKKKEVKKESKIDLKSNKPKLYVICIAILLLVIILIYSLKK